MPSAKYQRIWFFSRHFLMAILLGGSLYCWFTFEPLYSEINQGFTTGVRQEIGFPVVQFRRDGIVFLNYQDHWFWGGFVQNAIFWSIVIALFAVGLYRREISRTIDAGRMAIQSAFSQTK